MRNFFVFILCFCMLGCNNIGSATIGSATIGTASTGTAGVLKSDSAPHLDSPVFSISDSLFNLTKPDSLGLKYPANAVSAVAFYGAENISQYNHGAVLFPFKGQLYLQWQSSAQDEDADDTVVRYSTSTDGDAWSDAQILVPPRANATVTNGGWWSDGHTLVAYINVWPKDLAPRGGYVEYITTTDGKNWSAPVRLRQANGEFVNGVIEQDIKALPSGRLLTAVHTQPGLIVKPFFTDDPLGIDGWQQAAFSNSSYSGNVSNELEPSWFLKADGSVVMVFRDQASSFKVLAAISKDKGANWSKASATNMPDSRAKQSAGNLPNGTAYLVNNPTGTKTRTPLTITLSDEGKVFNRAYLLRGSEKLPPMRYQGLYKRIGYSYPKSVVWNGFLWVSYGINKEDIGVTRVPVGAL